MNRNFFLLSLGIGAMILATDHAMAQGAARCADHATIVAQLAERYDERLQSIGLGRDNSVLEVYASDATGSWSITVTKPGGPTCLVAAGQSFQMVTAQNTDDGA